MKKTILGLAFILGIITVTKAQNNYCKDIKKLSAAGVTYFNTPLPTWKGSEPEIQASIGKLVKNGITSVNFGLTVNFAGSAATANAAIEFEDGDKLEYTNLRVTGLPAGYGTLSVTFTLSGTEMDKLITKKIKSLSFLGHTVALPAEYQNKIMGYAGCLGSFTGGESAASNSTAPEVYNTKKPIEGFWGIKFGASQDEVKAAIAAKGGKLIASQSDADKLAFSNVTFTQRKAESLIIRFVGNKFYEAMVVFPPSDENMVMPDFKTIINELNDVYGDAKVTKSFIDPYKEGDKDEIFAIKIGKASFFARWVTSNNNSIQLQISKTLNMMLFYTDNTLEKANNTKKSSDY